MKIIAKSIKTTYWFKCPDCRSKLEAERQELSFMGKKVEFVCPVCQEKKTMPEYRLHARTSYEE